LSACTGHWLAFEWARIRLVERRGRGRSNPLATRNSNQPAAAAADPFYSLLQSTQDPSSITDMGEPHEPPAFEIKRAMTHPQPSMGGQGGTGRQTAQQQQATGGGSGGQRTAGAGASPIARLPLVMRMRTTAQRLARSLSSEVRSSEHRQVQRRKSEADGRP
jgi:hypothetical protein